MQIMDSAELTRAGSSPERLDRICALIPILACFFACVALPLLALAYGLDNTQQLPGIYPDRPENQIVWPALAAASIVLTARFRSRLAGLSLPSSVVCLLAYLLLAGASISWATDPSLSFRRYVLQVMIIVATVLPALLCKRRAVITNGLFICFSIASLINLAFVVIGPPSAIGHTGYFGDKNSFGQLAALAFISSLYESSCRGYRRICGVIVVLIAVILLVESRSKTSLGLALTAPILGTQVLAATRFTGLSPAIVLIYMGALCVAGYAVLSELFSLDLESVSMFLFGDPTFTSRTTIWNFATEMIERRPLLGWGYRSFWLVGPSAPSVLEAPEWVSLMPHAHNGYLDTILETGFLGFSLLVLLIISTFHGVGRIIDEEPHRAWVTLSFLIFIVLHNGLESTWVRGFDINWLVFAILAAEGSRRGRRPAATFLTRS